MKTWIDPATGLVWMVITQKPMTFYEAEDYADRFKYFFLPTRAQLLTLVDDTRVKPATSSGVNLGPFYYWTKTPYVGYVPYYIGPRVWYVSFGNGTSGHSRIGGNNSIKYSVCLVADYTIAT